MHIPAIGQTLSRDLMPQIKDPRDFLDELKLQGISHSLETLNPRSLKSTQSEFDANKVYQMMQSQGERKPIIVSQDGYVLDGHHRWLEAYNKGENVEAHVCKTSILDLLHHARRYVIQDIAVEKVINESIEHKNFGPMLDSFVKFASDKLGIKSLPNIRYKEDSDDFNSFACYHPGKKHIVVSIKNRHPMDVYRSVAHELVHQYQDETNRLYPGAGETGSDIEDEANYMAGRLLRHWAKANPEQFKLKAIQEAIFVVGGPCSGKDRVSRYLKELYDATELDIQAVDDAVRVYVKGNVIINASAEQIDLIKEAQMILEEGNGYSTQLYFVDTSNEISRLRNEARAEKGQRVLIEGVRFAKFNTAQKSKKVFSEMFRKDFHVIDNSIQEEKKNENKEIKVKVKVDQPKSKIESNSTKDSKPDPYKYKSEQENRKATADHYNKRAMEYQSRIDTVRGAMARLQPAGVNYHKVYKQLKQQLSGAILNMRKWQKQSLGQYTSSPSVNEQFSELSETWKLEKYSSPRTGNRLFADNHMDIDGTHVHAGYTKDDRGRATVNFEVDGSYTKYNRNKNGQKILRKVGKSVDSYVRHVKPKELHMNANSDRKEELYNTFAKKMSKKHPNTNFLVKRVDEHAGEWGTNELRARYQSDTPGQPVGFEEPYGDYLPKHVKDYLVNKRKEQSEEDPNIEQVPPDGIGQTSATSTPAWPQSRAGVGGIGAMTEAWMNNPRTIERFKVRYRDNWQQKIFETAQFLESQNIEVKSRRLQSFFESIDKGVDDMGTVPSQGKEEIEKPVEECGLINNKRKSYSKRIK